jgi:hypothetical protein
VKQVAATLTRHLDGVLIMSIKRKAGGFCNPSNFTTAIYFHCGGLDYVHADSGWF